LDLFLVSNPNEVSDFHSIAGAWSDYDMVFLSCCFERLRVATLYKNIQGFRDIYRDGLLGAAASLNWSAVWFMAKLNEIFECFYTMLLVRRIKVTKGTDYAAFAIGFTRMWSWQSTREMLLIRHDNINRLRGDRLWILYVRKRRYASVSGP
jgi:hypothetical protein